jgi:hypothetical protein
MPAYFSAANKSSVVMMTFRRTNVIASHLSEARA